MSKRLSIEKKMRRIRENVKERMGITTEEWRRTKEQQEKEKRVHLFFFLTWVTHVFLVPSSENTQGRGGTVSPTQATRQTPFSHHQGVFPSSMNTGFLHFCRNTSSPQTHQSNSPHHCVLCTDYPPDFPEQATSLAAWKHSPDGSSLHCRFS